MSPALGQPPGRSPLLVARQLLLNEARIPAKAHPSPSDRTTAQLVVLDSSSLPMARHFEEWAAQLASLGFERMRTGALAPRQSVQAEAAGLKCIQELVLLEARPPYEIPNAPHRTWRSRQGDMALLADVDHAAFGDAWRLDAAMLGDVRTATPATRIRAVRGRSAVRALGRHDDEPRSMPPVAGFLISGRAGRSGYVQRLAVDPAAQRLGIAASLLADSLGWLRRWKVERVYVNTHVENVPALALYRAHGFQDLPERLRVFEGPTRR